MPTPFRNRTDAGLQLAEALVRRWPELSPPHGPDAPLVLGLPRGGIVVAAEVARRLGAPLDALIVRKIGYPPEPEVAIGAIGPEGRVHLTAYVSSLGLSRSIVDAAVEAARAEWAERNRRLRGSRPAPRAAGKTVIVVDDGIATGATALAALAWVREAGAGRVIMAVPVAPEEAADTFANVADDFLCLVTPQEFYAVGQVYREFPQVDDTEVLQLLDAAK